MTVPSMPAACSLAPRDRTAALAWIAALNAASLRDYRRDDLSLTLVYAPKARARVLQLVREEQECCGFLTFAVRDDPDAVVLTITAPESGRTQLEPIFDAITASPSCAVDCGCAPEAPASASARRRRTVPTLAVGGLACAACCAVPLIVPLAGGALAGGSEWLCAPPVSGAAALATFAAPTIAWIAARRRRRNA